MDFEYAIKRDVRNNAIVREVDHARNRDLWRWLRVGVLLVGVLLFSAFQHFELLRQGYQFEQLEQRRVAQEKINRHLKLEIETLRSPRRIERLATERLNLIVPTSETAVIIERVDPPVAPTRAVLASR